MIGRSSIRQQITKPNIKKKKKTKTKRKKKNG